MTTTTLIQLKKLDLQPGDILHVRVGGNLTGFGDWIPDDEEIAKIRDEYTKLVPADVKVIVTHHLIGEQVIRQHRVHQWPPKSP